jgi:hypothetical protein
VPPGTALPLVPVAVNGPLEADHLEEVRKVVTAAHLENMPYWVSIFNGGVGGEPNVAPFDIGRLPRRYGLPPAPLPAVIPAVGAAVPNHPGLGEEIRVTAIDKHKASDMHEGSYRFKVRFEDGDYEWQELDDLVDPDYTVTESLAQYLAHHPQVKLKGTSLARFFFVIVPSDFYSLTLFNQSTNCCQLLSLAFEKLQIGWKLMMRMNVTSRRLIRMNKRTFQIVHRISADDMSRTL